MDDYNVSELALYFAMCLSIISIWIKNPFYIFNKPIKAWYVLFTLTSIASIIYGLIQVSGLIFCALLLASSYFTNKKHCPEKVKAASLVVTLLLCLSLSFHLISGFSRITIYDDFLIEGSKEPISFSINYGKFVIISFLIGVAYNKLSPPKEVLSSFISALRFGLAWVPLVLVLGYFLGAQFQFKIHPTIPLFASMNLLFTCTLEEVFFRGLIQSRLKEWLKKRTAYNAQLAIIIASTLFGIAHFSGGVEMVIAAI